MTPKQAFHNVKAAVQEYRGNLVEHVTLQESLKEIEKLLPKEDKSDEVQHTLQEL